MKEDKIEQMLHALEHPEDYTDEQLERLFNDEEVRDCYEIALRAEQHLSANEQPKSIPQATLQPAYWRKIAAVFIGMLLLSGIAIAAIQIGLIGSGKQTVQPETVTSEPLRSVQADAESLPKDTTITFENAELEAIMSQLSSHYHVGVDFHNEAARHLRFYTKWTPAETLEQVVDRLNGFEKVTIEETDKTLIIR